MKRFNSTAAVALMAVVCVTTIWAVSIFSGAKPAEAQGSVSYFPTDYYAGQLTTDTDDIVAAPGADKRIVIDRIEATVLSVDSDSIMAVEADSTADTEYFQCPMIQSFEYISIPQIPLEENEGLDVDWTNTGGTIWLFLRYHIDHVY